jgi:hypothetical protein
VRFLFLRMISAGKKRRVGDEREYEVEQIYEKEYDRNREAKSAKALAGRPRQLEKQREAPTSRPPA